MSQEANRAIASIKSAVITGDNYTKTDFGIKSYDEETKNVISSTFGVIKNNLMALWAATGLDINVTNIYTQTMMDPNQAMTFNNKTYFPHPGVGNLHPYNELGNPSDGVFQFHTLG